MEWETITWPIALDCRPTLLALGIGIHGDRPMEHYRLEGLWCLHLYRYTGKAVIGDRSFPIHPGHASITPPSTHLEHHWPRPNCTHITAHFALPAHSQESVLIPAMQNLGEKFTLLERGLEEAIGFFGTQPKRAEVRVWDILWQLVGTQNAAALQTVGMHSAVQKILQSIELRLGETLDVKALAAEVDLSPSHLSRLFQRDMHTTLVCYIRQRRIERAKHLLIYSSLPVKSIAAQVGISDLHLFNKAIRRAFGKPPRMIRQAVGSFSE